MYVHVCMHTYCKSYATWVVRCTQRASQIMYSTRVHHAYAFACMHACTHTCVVTFMRTYAAKP
jgi:hypothetical protein